MASSTLPSRIGEKSKEEWELLEQMEENPSGGAFCDGDPPEPPFLLLLLAISAKEVTRGGVGGTWVAPSLRRMGQLSMRSRDPSRGEGDLSRLRS